MAELRYLSPYLLDAPHKVTQPDHVTDLANSMWCSGWLGASLVGYQDGGRVQLLSGTHRLSAAILCGFKTIPVMVWEREDVEAAWGTENWSEIMGSGSNPGTL